MAKKGLIGIFIPFCMVGGVEQFFSELVRQKPLEGYDFHVSYFGKTPLSPIFCNGSRVKTIPVTQLESSFKRYPYKLWMTTTGGGGRFPSVLLSYKYGIPHIWALHAPFRETYPEFSLRQVRLSQEFIASFSFRIIAVSRFIRAGLSFTSKIPVQIIPNGCDPDRFQDRDGSLRRSFRKEFKLGPKDLAVGMIANLHPRKRQHILLEALSHLPMKERQIKCFFVGNTQQDPNYGREVIAQKDDSPWKRNVVFTGIRTDIPRVLAGLDIAVLPSWKEGSSIAILEAFAAGKPVIATRHGSFSEFITEGKTGLLIRLDDSQALARAIERLADQPQLREFLGANARSLVRNRFHIRDVARRYAEVFDSVSSPVLSLGYPKG